MTENNENIDELLSRFLDSSQMHKAAEDIRLGEELLESFSAPLPAKSVTDGIKAQIQVHLHTLRRRRVVRSMFYRVAVAAVFVVLAFAGARYLTEPDRKATGVATAAYASIWDDESGDKQLATLTAQVSEIEADMLAIRLGDSGTESSSLLTDLEVEMTEINGDFWKG
jgi:hypothetical protein